MKYPVLILAALVLVAASPTPPPSPPPLDQPTPSVSPGATFTVPPAPSSMPSATPTPTLDNIMGGHRGARGKGAHPDATPTPPVDTRKGLDGVWEIQIQRGPKTQYVHMKLDQSGDALAGYYLTDQNKKFPIAGALDGQHNIRLVVSRPDGTTILLEGRVDGTTDMIGMFTDSKERVPFTAAYRPKEKFIDNINAGPGMGGGYGGP